MNTINKFFLVVALLAVICLSPGVSGGFFFDDVGSLIEMGEGSGLNSWNSFWQYVLGGTAGPGGRPVALFTFALNGHSWPPNPKPYLWTNIFIHVLNGVVFYCFLNKILCTAKNVDPERQQWIPLLAAAFWLLHPFQVSTVLYIVQRMTSLAATFQLLAFLCYLNFRDALIALNVRRICDWLFLGGGCFVAAFFTKETALLLPIQICVLEVFCGIIYNDSEQLNIKRLRNLVVFPAAFVFMSYPVWVFFAHGFQYVVDGVEPASSRPFSLFERLLTEGRILGDYLCDIFAPKIQTAGVFHDGYVVSRSIIEPISTLYWWVFHIALIIFAVAKRKKWPILFFAVAWFYANHVLESSVFMLELKYEHRNYLAMAGISLLIACGILSLKLRFGGRVFVGCAAIFVLSVFQYMAASLWGNRVESGLVWVEKNPNSTRALDYAATVMAENPLTLPKATQLLKRAIELEPTDPVFKVKYYIVNCMGQPENSIDWDQLANEFNAMKVNFIANLMLRDWLDKTVKYRCPAFDLKGYVKVLLALKSNKNFENTSIPRLLQEELVVAPFMLGSPEQGLQTFLQQDVTQIFLTVAAQQALVVASHGYREQAAAFLEAVIVFKNAVRSEDSYVLGQSQEILQLIKNDIKNNPSATGK